MRKCVDSVARQKFAALFQGKPEKRLTLKKAAEALDMHLSHVSMVKNGRRDVTLNVAAKIERAYKIPAIEWRQKPTRQAAR